MRWQALGPANHRVRSSILPGLSSSHFVTNKVTKCYTFLVFPSIAPFCAFVGVEQFFRRGARPYGSFPDFLHVGAAQQNRRGVSLTTRPPLNTPPRHPASVPMTADPRFWRGASLGSWPTPMRRCVALAYDYSNVLSVLMPQDGMLETHPCGLSHQNPTPCWLISSRLCN